MSMSHDFQDLEEVAKEGVKILEDFAERGKILYFCEGII